MTLPANLSRAALVTGLFTEHALVIAEGVMDDDRSTFLVTTLGFPPVETRAESLAAHPTLQPYSGM